MKLGPLFANILFVDDDAALVRAVRLMLQSAGYVVRAAGSGEKALEMVKAKPPDLILLDVSLPGIDGYEVTRQLKADTALPFIPIILVTGHTRDDLATGLNTGADEFIGKPFENSELLIRVRAMLRLKTKADRLTELEESTRRLFMTYMPEPVAQVLLADPGRARPGGQRRKVTILFADMEGFTSWAERTPPEQVLNFLNVALSTMAQAITARGGTVDKFMGDGLMAIFNAPLEQSDHACQAVRAAHDIQYRFASIEIPGPMQVNIGLHSGEAVVGNVGGAELLNYTAVGDAVNLAKRLQEIAHGGQILISEDMLAKVCGCVEGHSLGERMVHGRQSPVMIYEVTEVRV